MQYWLVLITLPVLATPTSVDLLPKGIKQPFRERQFQVAPETHDELSTRAKRSAGAIIEVAPSGSSLFHKRQSGGYDFTAPAPRPSPQITKHSGATKSRLPALLKPATPVRRPKPPPQHPPASYPDEPVEGDDATRYYYPPRFPLPLSKCFHNPTGYVCCNPELNDLMVKTFTDLEALPKFHTCNIQKMANEIQNRAQMKFNATFETIVSFEDYAQKIHFKGDLVCKVELGGRYMLAYAAIASLKDDALPPEEIEPMTGPIPENHISRRNSVRMYPKSPVPIRDDFSK